MTVHPSVPAKNVRSWSSLIKANPGKYSFAAPGAGSTPHLSGEIFRISQGIDLVTVQFTGAGPAIQNTVGGHTPIAFTAMPPAAPQIKDGKLRALVVTSEKRAPGFPDVPTMAEAGLAGQEAYTLTGMLAPAGTPKEIVDLLHREIVKIVALPDVLKRLDDLGFEVVANSPDEFAARIKTELEKWGKVIRDARIKMDGAQSGSGTGAQSERRPRAALFAFTLADNTIRPTRPTRSWPWSALSLPVCAPSRAARRHRRRTGTRCRRCCPWRWRLQRLCWKPARCQPPPQW